MHNMAFLRKHKRIFIQTIWQNTLYINSGLHNSWTVNLLACSEINWLPNSGPGHVSPSQVAAARDNARDSHSKLDVSRARHHTGQLSLEHVIIIYLPHTLLLTFSGIQFKKWRFRGKFSCLLHVWSWWLASPWWQEADGVSRLLSHIPSYNLSPWSVGSE